MNVNLILNYSSNLYSENKVNIYNFTSHNATILLSYKLNLLPRLDALAKRQGVT